MCRKLVFSDLSQLQIIADEDAVQHDNELFSEREDLNTQSTSSVAIEVMSQSLSKLLHVKPKLNDLLEVPTSVVHSEVVESVMQSSIEAIIDYYNTASSSKAGDQCNNNSDKAILDVNGEDIVLDIANILAAKACQSDQLNEGFTLSGTVSGSTVEGKDLNISGFNLVKATSLHEVGDYELSDAEADAGRVLPSDNAISDSISDNNKCSDEIESDQFCARTLTSADSRFLAAGVDEIQAIISYSIPENETFGNPRDLKDGVSNIKLDFADEVNSILNSVQLEVFVDVTNIDSVNATTVKAVPNIGLEGGHANEMISNEVLHHTDACDIFVENVCVQTESYDNSQHLSEIKDYMHPKSLPEDSLAFTVNLTEVVEIAIDSHEIGVEDFVMHNHDCDRLLSYSKVVTEVAFDEDEKQSEAIANKQILYQNPTAAAFNSLIGFESCHTPSTSASAHNISIIHNTNYQCEQNTEVSPKGMGDEGFSDVEATSDIDGINLITTGNCDNLVTDSLIVVKCELSQISDACKNCESSSGKYKEGDRDKDSSSDDKKFVDVNCADKLLTLDLDVNNNLNEHAKTLDCHDSYAETPNLVCVDTDVNKITNLDCSEIYSDDCSDKVYEIQTDANRSDGTDNVQVLSSIDIDSTIVDTIHVGISINDSNNVDVVNFSNDTASDNKLNLNAGIGVYYSEDNISSHQKNLYQIIIDNDISTSHTTGDEEVYEVNPDIEAISHTNNGVSEVISIKNINIDDISHANIEVVSIDDANCANVVKAANNYGIDNNPNSKAIVTVFCTEVNINSNLNNFSQVITSKDISTSGENVDFKVNPSKISVTEAISMNDTSSSNIVNATNKYVSDININSNTDLSFFSTDDNTNIHQKNLSQMIVISDTTEEEVAYKVNPDIDDISHTNTGVCDNILNYTADDSNSVDNNNSKSRFPSISALSVTVVSLTVVSFVAIVVLSLRKRGP